MIVKSTRHAIFGMLLLLIILSLHDIGPVRNTYAFDFEIPNIPFLNFNLDYRDSSINKDNLPDNELGEMSARLSDNYNDIKSFGLFSGVGSDTFSSNFDTNNGNKLYDSLPFPSNTINNVVSDQTNKKTDEAISDDRDFNQISSYIPSVLPLISEYTDFPSSFILDYDTEVGKEIPH
jgi:hypothetical protein